MKVIQPVYRFSVTFFLVYSNFLAERAQDSTSIW